MPASQAGRSDPCCVEVPTRNGRALISAAEATELMALFKVLANDSRLRLLHALICAKELCVTSLARAVGMKPQAVSNQLQRLADRGIVRARRQGNTVYYRVVNQCVTDLLDRGLCLIENGCPSP